MNKLTKAVVSMYAAGSLFLSSGCATVSMQRTPYETKQIASRKITSGNQTTGTIEDMISISENFDKVVGYSERFENIKQKIKSNPNYDSRGEIYKLAKDIENDLGNKSDLLRVVKDFDYYIDEEVVEYKKRNLGWLGGAAFVGALVAEAQYTLDHTDEDEYMVLKGVGAMALTATLAGLMAKSFDNVKGKKQKTYKRRIHFNPYSGSIEVIKTW